ncbi:MAG: ABC transporter permease [Oscillospiraceae bacterium]|nr:ABC transporter permease [Oscillospiraceae bacterium]
MNVANKGIIRKLAFSQLKTHRKRTIWTLLGIILSTSMITAVFGFAASGAATITDIMDGNAFYTDMYNSTIYAMAAVFVSIIIAASVIVISNAFRVSADERTRQFGLLKCVGTTKKQIIKIIMHESLVLSAVAVPIGIILGLFVHFAGIEIVNALLAGLNRLTENPLILNFVFAWQAILLSVAVALLTVLFSAWLPARKAAKKSVIDSIRGSDEFKAGAKQIRANPIVKKLFGVEGALASKSIKRSRRNFRATVISLTVSVTLLIVVGSFGEQMRTMTDVFYPDIDATVAMQFVTSMSMDYSDEIVTRDFATIDSKQAGNITEQLRGFGDTPVYGAGLEYHSYEASIPREMMTPKLLDIYGNLFDDEFVLGIGFAVADAENYAELCKIAGVPIGSNILVNRYTHYQDGGREVFAPYIFGNQTLRVTGRYDDTAFDFPLHGELAMTEVPGEIYYASTGSVIVIVPEFDVTEYFWFAKPADKDGFIEHAFDVLDGIAFGGNEAQANTSIVDIEAQIEAMRGIPRLITVFVYGFVGMLTLIGLTNVISTISANVRLRSREFAVLRCVGMTHGGLLRMLNLESVLCSMKSLVIGIPLGIAGSYLVYRGFVSPVTMSYALPWAPILQCAFGVFVLTWAVMRFSASRLRGGSIVEALRLESGS